MQILNTIKRQTEKLVAGLLPTKKELSSRIFTPSKYDRWPTDPSSGLTPEKLAIIFKEADAGWASRQAELFAEMEEKDAHLGAVLQTRRLAISGRDWEIQPFSEDDKDVKVAEFIGKALASIQYSSDEYFYEGFEGAILALLDAIGKGYAGVEIIWESGAPEKLVWINPKRFTFYKDWPRPRITTDKELVYGEEVPQNKIIFHRHSARSGFTPRIGLLRPCSWLYVFKNFSIKDWLVFAESYGMPLRLGKVPDLQDQNAVKTMREALHSLGSSASGIVSETMSIEFVEAEKRASADIYKAFIELCERGQSKAVLGQTLTTEVGDKGSYAASKTHGEVRQDILEADCEQLSNTLRMQLIRPTVLFNFGEAFAQRLPWLKFKYELPEDLNAQANRDKILVESGLRIPSAYMYNKYNIPVPEAGEEVVSPPSRSPVFPPTDFVGAGLTPALEKKSTGA